MMKEHRGAVTFISYLRQSYGNDRGARAALRGALSESRRHRAWPLLGSFLNEEHNLRTYEIAAALWADADREAKGVDLGTAMRKLAGDLSSFEGRFKRLLACSRAEVADQSAGIVRALHARGVGLDYTLLLSDFLWWGDRVKVRWAQHFWGVEAGAEVPQELISSEESTP